MTIALFDLTEHTQMSIRGTTGTHPDSKYVFGIHISTDEIHAEQLGLTPDISAYDDMDWSKAVELAKWVTEGHCKIHPESIQLTDNCSMHHGWDDPTADFKYTIGINVPKNSSLWGMITDSCGKKRAKRLADWILEWDERFKEEEE